jgi:hypothetical protein
MADAKPTGIVGTHAEAETEGTALRNAEHKRGSNLRNIAILAVLTVAGIYAGYQIFPSGSGTSGGATLSLGGRLLIGVILYLMAKSIAKLLHVLGILGKDKDKEESTVSIIKAAGVLTVLLSLVFSGTGLWVSKNIDRIDVCLATGDCEPRIEDIPVIHDGGSVVFQTRETKNFYVEGEVLLVNNNAHYCLNIGPPGVFERRVEAGGRHVYITSVSGDKELASVRLKHRSECS